MAIDSQPGKLITFYSYKGGTGRSMCLANVACLLAKQTVESSKQVLVMDWDLEAPGLHRYFTAQSDQPANMAMPGLINFFYDLRRLLDDDPGLYDKALAPQGWKVLDELIPLKEYVIPNVVSGVDLIKAGRFDSQYSGLVAAFDWADFHKRYGLIIGVLRDLLASKYAYCLIDSRTGVTDVSGICTTILPEKLVAVFTPNYQSLYGILEVVGEAIKYRGCSDDFRPLSIFPLPSRIELAEKVLREEWRKQYQREFEALFCRAYEIEPTDLDLTAYFDEVQLPHVSYYAYGEKIAVLEERADALSLSRALRDFFQRLVELDEAWEIPGELPRETVPSIQEHEVKYDVFLSYATSDKSTVEDLANRLQESGVRVYFDGWFLTPGEDFERTLETAMAESATVAVCFGPLGVNPLGDEKTQIALKAQVRDPLKRVIPVLLPGAAPDKIPRYLQHLTHVDFHESLNEPETYKSLLSAVTVEDSSQDIKRLRKSNRTVSFPWLGTLRKRHFVTLAVLAVLAITTALVLIYTFRRPANSIAVLPFVIDNPDPRTRQAADRMVQAVINSFSQVSGLRVSSFNLVQQYKDKEVDPRAVGRELNVPSILYGRISKVQSDETSIIVNLELINTRDGSQLWAMERTVKTQDQSLLVDEIVTSVSNTIGLNMTAEERKRLAAESLYVKGRNAWNKRKIIDIQQAIVFFKQALDLNPNYAMAHAGLADCYNMLAVYGGSEPTEAFRQAREAATKSLAIDTQLVEGHTALAYTYFRGDWNWLEAEKEFKQAISINDNYSWTHLWYGSLLSAEGRFDEAIKETRRAQQIEKTSPIINIQLGLVYYFQHQYNEAVTECKKTIELDPSFFAAQRYLGLSYSQMGRHQEAIAEFEKALNASGDSQLMKAEYASALALSGDTAKAQAQLNSLLEMSKQKYVSAYHVAAIYIGLKDKDQAFTWLNKAFQDRADWMVNLKVDPRFDSIRSDPRFTELLGRMKF